MKNFLNKKQILEAKDRKVQELEVPEWGGWVRVMELDALGRATIETLTVKMHEGKIEQDNSKQRAILVALSVVDDNDKPLFTIDEVDALNRKSANAMKRVADVAMDLSFRFTLDDNVKN